MSRDFTVKLLDMVNDGLLDKDMVIMACVKYMSEDEVRDMMFANDFVDDWDEKEWDDDEPDVDEAQEWHDYDADC